MLFDTFSESSLLCNVSVTGATSESGTIAFRGDMIIVEGDIADAQGRRLPPKSTVKQAVALAKNDKMFFISGAVDDVKSIPAFIDRYKDTFADDVLIIFYTRNLGKGIFTTINGVPCTLSPHDEGAVWSMLMDDFRLEKSDFKGQSAEDKCITMYEGETDFKPKFEEVDFTCVSDYTIEVKREARGPV